MSLPVTGSLNWGVPLNAYITNDVLAVANQALTAINTHTAASDPHGDRAYAAGLVSPITTGVNAANGYVKLNGSGKLTSSMLPSGSGLTNFFDVVANYGTVGNGATDDSTAIQNALNDCATAGGGEVWLGDGNFALGSQLVIGANTWLHLSPGATIKRIIPVSSSAPSIMIANVSFVGGTHTPATGNILISGGTWDAVGSGLTSACTPIMLIQASFSAVEQVYLNGVAGNPLIEVNGCTYFTARDCVLTGAALSTSSSVPAIRLNSSSSSTTPAGMAAGAYNNAVCSYVMVEACPLVTTTGGHPPCGKLLGSDLYSSPYSHSHVAVTGCASPGDADATQPQVDFVHATSSVAFGNQLNTASTETLDLTTTGQVFVGPTVSGASLPNVYVAGNIVSATGYMGNFTAETWHHFSTPSGWTDNSDTGTDGFRYKLLATGVVVLDVNMKSPSSPPSDGTTIATLPAGYRPLTTRVNVPLYTTDVVASGAHSPSIFITTGGAVTVYGMQGAAYVGNMIMFPVV